MEDQFADQTGVKFNNSANVNEDVHVSSPIINNENGAISKENNNMSLDEDVSDTTFITVTKKSKKRFRTTIKGIHVLGDSLNRKIDNMYEVLADKEGFLECRPYFDRINKEAWITAIFDSQEAADKATELELFENNEFHLTHLKDRGDREVQSRTLIIRDLPLDVNRSLLKAILENQFGKIDSIKYRLAGPWYRADATFESNVGIENNLDCWSIQYKKDLCRVAPAFFTREDIDYRNQFTVKLTNIPYGTTPIDLKEILQKVNAKTCFMPRTRSRYNRKRFAYVSFASDEDLQKVMTNIRVMYNGTELFWDVEDAKTCHKCGSSKHLVVDCPEKESADNFREYKNQFSNIYNKYKVPNYRNLTKKSNDNNKSSHSTSTKNQNPKSASNHTTTNDLQNMMENALKSLTRNIEEKFINITKQLDDVNNRIKLLEIKVGLDKPKAQTPKSATKNNSNKYDMSYIATTSELEKKNENDKYNNNENPTQKTEDLSNKNKRPLSDSDNSSNEDKSPKQNQIKPRRKSIRLTDNEQKDSKNSTIDHSAEIDEIKTTQLILAKEFGELKELFVNTLNTALNNNGNGSSSSSFH